MSALSDRDVFLACLAVVAVVSVVFWAASVLGWRWAS